MRVYRMPTLSARAGNSAPRDWKEHTQTIDFSRGRLSAVVLKMPIR